MPTLPRPRGAASATASPRACAEARSDHQARQLDAQLVTDTDVDAFAGCDLVIEAVPEDLELKLDALRRVEAAIEPGTPLASNTSSISIDTLAENARPPRRLPRAALLQPGAVVAARRDRARGRRPTPRWSTARAGWVTALGKTPIVVRDSPGFASSRLGVAARGSRRSGCSRRASRAPTTSTRRWCSATSTRSGRCASPTSSASTCASASSSTCTPSSATASNRPPCCDAWSPRASSAARPARASSSGRTTT